MTKKLECNQKIEYDKNDDIVCSLCPECSSKSYKLYTNPHSKVTRTYCLSCGYGLNELEVQS